MSTLFIILLFFGIVILAILFLKSKFSRSDIPEELVSDDFPYLPQEVFLTPAERSFFGVLEQVVDGSCRVFAKVRIADLLSVKKGLDSRDRVPAQNKINSKHVDFVLCDMDRVSILAAIELDDKSHGAKKRQDRDFFVDEAFKAAGVPLVRVPAKKQYSLSEIKSLVSDSIGVENLLAEALVTEVVTPTCSACGSNMVKRQAKKGKHAGSFFWACSAYPKCRQLISIK